MIPALFKIEKRGAVRPDDGHSAWNSTIVSFGWGQAGMVADLRIDGYTGKTVAHIVRDDFRLPVDLLGRLAIALYRECASGFSICDADYGEALLDIEPMVHEIFYWSHAETLLRKFRAAAVGAAHHSKQSVSKQ